MNFNVKWRNFDYDDDFISSNENSDYENSLFDDDDSDDSDDSDDLEQDGEDNNTLNNDINYNEKDDNGKNDNEKDDNEKDDNNIDENNIKEKNIKEKNIKEKNNKLNFDLYKDFYYQPCYFCAIKLIYINNCNEIIEVKNTKFNCKNPNIISRDELLGLIKFNSYFNNKRYYLLSLLKYNFFIKNSDINTFIKSYYFRQFSNDYFQIIKSIDDIRFSNTIYMFHNLNELIIVFYEKTINIDNNINNNIHSNINNNIHSNNNKNNNKINNNNINNIHSNNNNLTKKIFFDCANINNTNNNKKKYKNKTIRKFI